MKSYNELQLAKELIKFPTVTPNDAGIINYLVKILKPIGFDCKVCLLYTSPSPRDRQKSRMPSSA